MVRAAPPGNGADTYAGGMGDRQFDFAGVLFAAPQYGVTSIRVQNYLANDGGWWGSTSVINGGAPLAAADLTAPIGQVTSDAGATCVNVGGVANDYVAKYTEVVRGTGFPNATSAPWRPSNSRHRTASTASDSSAGSGPCRRFRLHRR